MSTTKQSNMVLIEQAGAPGVLKYQAITLQAPAPGEVLINQKAIGVNFVDVFFRNGSFPMLAYPAPIGLEAAGVIEAVGQGVQNYAVGDYIAYHSSPGAYAESRLLKATDIFKLPNGITFDQAAAVMLKGLTAHMLVKLSYQVKAGDVVLIHAMAGGVGSLLSSWAQHLGATVIGTVGSATKKERMLSRGFKHVVDLQTEDFAAVVNEVTQGRGIDVVYDSIGELTFQKSVALLKNGGSAILYGWASGMPVIDTKLMEDRKINYVHPALNNYLADHAATTIALNAVFDLVREGVLQVEAPTVYALANASTAHADLESRKTTGSIILRP